MGRASIETDIVCVGAGVASLATVLRLLRRIREGNGAAGARPPPRIMIVEKGKQVGDHVLSGCVLDPEPLGELLSDRERDALPIESTVRSEAFYRLGRKHALRVPWVPFPMRDLGYPLVSLSKFTRYLGDLCEAAGVDICTGFAAAALLRDADRIVGVRIGDKGLDRDGKPMSNFEPGSDVRARVVVLGEGACGILADKLIAENGLGAQALSQTYAVGIKEIIETPPMPDRAGSILHTFGFPHDARTYGGGFLYGLNATRIAVGLVTALDYRDATLNPHDLFREFKAHPLIRSRLQGGRVIGYGAKLIPEGGLFCVPSLATDGAIIVGDGAGLLDSLRLKGVHIAIQSGIAAGDALFDAWRSNDFSFSRLKSYPDRFRFMSGRRQLRRVRNVRACFSFGTIPGMLGVGLSVFTNGLLPFGLPRMEPDWATLRRRRKSSPPLARGGAVGPPDPALSQDRLTDLFHSGTRHREDQPCHLRIVAPEVCRRDCIPEFGAPCTLFCPAQVYSLNDAGDGIRIDAANCLHCKTCQIKDPFRNIEWTLPEGEGGPQYREM